MYKRAHNYIKEKIQHPGLQKYAKNISWMFLGRIITLGVSFFVGIYIARYLGPYNYGILNYVTSFVGLFGFLTSFGIDNIINREIIKDHNKKDAIIGTGFYIKTFGSILAILSVFFVSFFTTKDLFTLGLIWLFSLNFIPQAFNVLEIYFQSQILSKKSVKAQMISTCISTFLKLFCIILGKGIFWLMIIYLIETSIYSLILLFSFKRFGNTLKKWRFNFDIAKSLLKDSWPIMVSSIAVGIYMKIDQVMIKNMLGNEQSGIYAVSVKLSEVWYFIPGIISASVLPSLINAKKISMDVYRNRLQTLYSIVFWISIFIALFLTIFSYKIIFLLFGDPYLGAVETLKIYVWAGVGVSLGAVLNQYLLIENWTKTNFIITTLGAIINIVLNFFFIPSFGILGAAVATLISYNASIISILLFPKMRGHIKIILCGIFFIKQQNKQF